MTLEQLEKRIAQLRGRPLILLCRTRDGREQKMTVRECIESRSEFLHVAAGDDADALDALLEYELSHIEVKETKSER